MGSTPAGYSASRISSILGVNPYQTQVEIWQLLCEEMEPGFNEKNNYILPVFDGNAATRFGLAFESAICTLVENKFSTKITNREKFYSKTFDGITLTAHVDGESENGWLTENKTTTVRSFYSIKDDKKTWGLEGTDEVPIQYQLQCAAQRICSGFKEVKLNVLIFPETPETWEEMGWEVVNDLDYGPMIDCGDNNTVYPSRWADSLCDMGFFKTYNLPSNPDMENLIIEKIKKFDADYVKTKIPPKATDYADVRRLLTQPMGTIIATEELKKMAAEYSEIVRQVGKSGPLAKRQEKLKVDIMNTMMTMNKNDWADPPDKMVLLDPDGGEVLVNFGKQFRARKAR